MRLIIQKLREPMTMGIRGGGEGEEVCCGWYFTFMVTE